MQAKVKQVLSQIVEQFKSGDIPKTVAYSVFPMADVPSAKWSLLNRTFMFLAGTSDGRGFRQWKSTGRYVKKGSKAFYILVPFFKKVEDDNGDESQVLSGFGARPVFKVEDTDGEPLDYEQIELPSLPLMAVAKKWDLDVKAIPGNYRYYGYYSAHRKEIALATKNESVFFHELAHAAHHKVKGKLKKGQDPFEEIVAELSAQALCRMVGKQPNDTLGNSFRYIERYAKKLNISPHTACLKVMSETEKVLNLILKGENNEA